MPEMRKGAAVHEVACRGQGAAVHGVACREHRAICHLPWELIGALLGFTADLLAGPRRCL